MQDDVAVGDVASSLKVVDCAEEHNSQAYHEATVSGVDSFDDEAIEEFANQACYEAFEGFIGIPYEESELEYYYFGPTQETWDSGDHDIVCYVWAGGDTLTESLEGSER